MLHTESTKDANNAMVIAHEYRIPVIPFSHETSLVEHFIAPHDGIRIDMSRMHQILRVDVEEKRRLSCCRESRLDVGNHRLLQLT